MRSIRSHARQVMDEAIPNDATARQRWSGGLPPGTTVAVHELQELVDVERPPEVMLAPRGRPRDRLARTSAADQKRDSGPRGVRVLCRAEGPPAVRRERVENDDARDHALAEEIEALRAGAHGERAVAALGQHLAQGLTYIVVILDDEHLRAVLLYRTHRRLLLSTERWRCGYSDSCNRASSTFCFRGAIFRPSAVGPGRLEAAEGVLDGVRGRRGALVLGVSARERLMPRHEPDKLAAELLRP